MPRKLRAVAMAMLIGLASLSLGGVARAADPALADEALKRLQISGEQRRGLLRGEVISYPVGEYSERELAVGLALFVMAPLGQVAEYLASGKLLARDATISAHGLVPDPATPAGLPAVRFSGSERNEAESLLEAGPGTRFNLSSAEIEALRALRASGSVTAEQVSDEYRKLLRDR